MKKPLSVIIILGFLIPAKAQDFKIDAAEQGLKQNVHWVKRTWYKPIKNGEAWAADKSSVPNIYLRPNQLIEYSKEGKMKAVMDYLPGTVDQSGPTRRYVWEGKKLKSEAFENAGYVLMNSATYTYDPEGHETRKETRRGPGDQFGFTQNNSLESVWKGSLLTKQTLRDEKGALLNETSFTYDANGRKVREDYYPVSFYSGKTFEYDAKGNLIKETDLDKSGQPNMVRTYVYNSSNRIVKSTMTAYSKGIKTEERLITTTWNSQGDKTGEVHNDGKKTISYGWQHSYDSKGNRIQTVHLKDGVAIEVEVLELRYY